MNGRSSVLLLGGTAQVGVHVLGNLQQVGLDTICLSRNLQSPQKKDHSSGSKVWWFSPEQFKAGLAGSVPSVAGVLPSPDVLISAGPISLANEYLDLCPKLQRVVCLSTSSVLSKADSDDVLERQQMEQILQAEQRLEQTCASRNIGLVILRPTLIYGCGLDENVSRMARFIQRFGFLPLAGRAQGLRQPVHVADLAALMVKIARSPTTGQQTYTVAGGSTLTYREMAAAVFRALGKKERLISLPCTLLASAISLIKPLSGAKTFNAQMVLRQNRDLVFDDQAVRQRYGFQPREFQPGPADFTLSAELGSYLPAEKRP